MRRTAFLLLAYCFALGITQAMAQDEAQRGIATVAGDEEEAIEPAAPLEFDRKAVLPTPPPPERPGQLQAIGSVLVTDLQLNSTVLSAEELDALFQRYENRELSVEQLDALRNALSTLYFDRGYVNSGVTLPDQEVRDGVIVFQEILGSVTDIRLQGNRSLSSRYWMPRIERSTAAPLQINRLQDTLQLMEQHPLIRRIEASLQPGNRPGESVLLLDVTEHSPWQVVIGADNHRSPSLGGYQGTVYVAHQSLFGVGDKVELYFNGAEGLGDLGGSYSVPIGGRGATIRGYFSGGDAEIVEEPFDLIDVESQTRRFGMEAAVPFMANSRQTLTGLVGLEVSHSESTLLGIPFNFSLGEIQGQADATAFVAGGVWTWRGAGQALALRLTVRQGTDWFGAQTNARVPEGINGPDTDFFSHRGQLQYQLRLPWLSSELRVRSAWQLAADPLLPVEKMPVGGAYSVRGYRENLLVRDNGVAASVEWRVPLFPDRTVNRAFDPWAISLAAFGDFGQSWDQNTGLLTDEKVKIYSLGLGVLWAPWKGLSVELYRGEALKDLQITGDDPQDDGWHGRISYAFF